MKLLALNLKAVGPFTDVSLDFSAPDRGLHLIHGPNEAGKSSALRALSHWLFGFPHLSCDDFVHNNDRLRVGGKLLHGDGGELECVRRRGRLNTLRGPDDDSIVPEELLARFLGGLDQASFESLFGIDHKRLVRGGEEVRTGKGRLGELLFAAGSGLMGLKAAQERLREKKNDLFKPRGQNQRINKAIKDFSEARKKLKDDWVPTEEWKRHDEALAHALAESRRLREALDQKNAEQSRLERIEAAVPVVAKRGSLMGKLAGLGDAPRLHDGFGEDLRAALDQHGQAERTIQEAGDRIEKLDSESALLDPPEALLDAGADVESLFKRMGAEEKAVVDRVRLENFRGNAEHEGRRLLHELGWPADLDQAEHRRLRADEPAIIRVLGQEFARLKGQAEQARQTIARHEQQLKKLEQELARLESSGAARDLGPLRRAVKQARKAGDLDERLGEARGQFARASKIADTGLAQLPWWGRPEDDLRNLVPPLEATLDQFEARFSGLEKLKGSYDEQSRATAEEIRRAEARLRSLDRERDVPTENDLLAARERREQGWRLVRSAWLEGAAEGTERDAWLDPFGENASLESAYEQAVRNADLVADRLRREADHVASKMHLLGVLESHYERRKELERNREVLAGDRAALDREWNGLVVPIGLTVSASPAPAELSDWLRRREKALEHIEQREEARRGLEPLQHEAGRHRDAVVAAMIEAGESAPGPDAVLSRVLELAEEAIQRQDDLVKRRTKLEGQIENVRRELEEAQTSARAAESALLEWRPQWSEHMERIGLEADARPEQAEGFLTRIAELAEQLKARREHESRIRGIDRDARKFAADVADLAARVAPDLASNEPREALHALNKRLRQARDDRKQKDTLLQQRARETEKLESARERRAEALVRLRRYCQEAGGVEIAELADAERRSRERAGIEDGVAECDELLRNSAGKIDLDAFIDEVRHEDPDVLRAGIERLKSDKGNLLNELGNVDQTIGAERKELERMDGMAGGADAAEEAQTIAARARGDIERFAVLDLASSVLARSIERYREKHQGPILGRAGALFELLTGGSFACFKVDDDGEGKLALIGVRPDGAPVRVEGMSDGSQEQLYLALRLASLESWLQAHEPVPFVVDDILLNFDDRRAAAALRALAEFSRRSQVLFFTHHRHIIELAREHLDPGAYEAHELPGPEARLARA